jgi:hypothetical protein
LRCGNDDAGSKPRIVNIFITAVEAWDWINEQESVNKFAAHEAKGQKGKRCRSPDA